MKLRPYRRFRPEEVWRTGLIRPFTGKTVIREMKGPGFLQGQGKVHNKAGRHKWKMGKLLQLKMN